MKKLLGCLVALALIVSMCATAVAESEPVKITVWHAASGANAAFIESLIDQYKEVAPNVDVELVYVQAGETTVQKLMAAAASNTLPNALLLAWPQYIGPMKDVIRTLDDFIAQYPEQWNEDDWLDSLLEGNCRYQGVTYGVPFESNNLALYYNVDMFNAAGVKVPTTWDELVEVAQALTNKEEKTWGLYLECKTGEQLSWKWQTFLTMAGGQMCSDDGSKLLFNSEAGLTTMQFFVDLFNKYECATLAPADNAFLNGMAAMTITGPWGIPNMQASETLNFDIAPLPAGPVCEATNIGGTVNLMFQGTEEQEKASWDFMMWLAQPETISRFAVGYGTIPVRKSASGVAVWQEYLKAVPGLQAHIDVYKYGLYRPYQLTTYNEISTILSTHIEAALYLQETPEEALQLAYEESSAVRETWLD